MADTATEMATKGEYGKLKEYLDFNNKKGIAYKTLIAFLKWWIAYYCGGMTLFTSKYTQNFDPFYYPMYSNVSFLKPIPDVSFDNLQLQHYTIDELFGNKIEPKLKARIIDCIVKGVYAQCCLKMKLIEQDLEKTKDVVKQVYSMKKDMGDATPIEDGLQLLPSKKQKLNDGSAVSCG